MHIIYEVYINVQVMIKYYIMTQAAVWIHMSQ